jgi:hypothetical protein
MIKKGRRQKKSQVEQKIFCDFGKKSQKKIYIFKLPELIHFQVTTDNSTIHAYISDGVLRNDWGRGTDSIPEIEVGEMLL